MLPHDDDIHNTIMKNTYRQEQIDDNVSGFLHPQTNEKWDLFHAFLMQISVENKTYFLLIDKVMQLCFSKKEMKKWWNRK